jgi:hypothetical protein
LDKTKLEAEMKTKTLVVCTVLSLMIYSCDNSTGPGNNDHHNDVPLLPLFSSCLLLDGDDDYAELASFENNTGSLTIEAWVNFASFTEDVVIVEKEHAYLLKGDYSKDGSTIMKGALILLQGVGLCGSSSSQYGGGGFWEPGWHHVAAVFNASTSYLRLYMDGEELHSWESGAHAFTNSDDVLKVGVDLDGRVDEMRISNVARYTGDTYTIQSEPFQNDDNTLALWHFDDSKGSTEFKDSSGRNLILTGHNGARITSDDAP